MPHRHGRGSLNPTHLWWIAIFRDVQFWIPIAVLLIGLLLLRFVG
jgi:hypothetical protein